MPETVSDKSGRVDRSIGYPGDSGGDHGTAAGRVY